MLHIFRIFGKDYYSIMIYQARMIISSSTLSDAAKKDIASLRSRAEALDEKLRQIKGKRPTMQEVVEECRTIRQEMYDKQLNSRKHG